MDLDLGIINSNILSLVMSTMVDDGVNLIRSYLPHLRVSIKENLHKTGTDYAINAGKAAQDNYIRLILSFLPGIGIVAEEGELNIPCTIPGHDIFFTIDPDDGSKALARRQSYNIGSMLSLVYDGEVVAACIGDVMTRETYVFKPISGSIIGRISKISEVGFYEELRIDRDKNLSDQRLLLTEMPSGYSANAELLIEQVSDGVGLFKSYEIESGSIGIMMARLWKGEVGGMLLAPCYETPWDRCPVYGINKRMGFVGLNADKFPDIEVVNTPNTREGIPRDFDLLIVHESRIEEVEEYFNNQA